MHSSALSPLLSSSDAGSSVSSLRYSPAAIKKWHICDVGIAERQKVGKQGKDNSIKLFSIQHFLFQYTCILCYYPYLVSLFSCHSHITTFHYVINIILSLVKNCVGGFSEFFHLHLGHSRQATAKVSWGWQKLRFAQSPLSWYKLHQTCLVGL